MHDESQGRLGGLGPYEDWLVDIFSLEGQGAADADVARWIEYDASFRSWLIRAN